MVRKQITCTAPVNIAVIKYWGKRDEKLLLAVNSSLSVTLNQDDLKTQTTIVLDTEFDKDRIVLNGREEKIENVRLQNVLKAVRERTENDELKSAKVHIISKNNFPTAAGLASSAAGYACLAYTLAKAFEIKEKFDGELSIFARVGSGSACRSLYGGFVRWSRGLKDDGTDSFASQVAPESHWPELKIFVLVVSDQKKEESSTSGQQTSVQTSPFLKYRADSIVEPRMIEMEKAINDKDFQTFGKLTMQDSNSFHAVCMDTYPPIFYMNDTSRSIVRLISNWNRQSNEIKAAYTFDAGPNAVVYVEEKNADAFAALVRRSFPSDAAQQAFLPGYENASIDDATFDALDIKQHPNALKYVITTSVGDGPRTLDTIDDLKQEYPGYEEK